MWRDPGIGGGPESHWPTIDHISLHRSVDIIIEVIIFTRGLRVKPL